MTCLINSQASVGDAERGYNAKVSEYVEEARAMGLKVLPPCIRRSGAWCSIESNEAGTRPDLDKSTIRFGLAMIKQVNTKAVAWIMTHLWQVTSFKDWRRHDTHAAAAD